MKVLKCNVYTHVGYIQWESKIHKSIYNQQKKINNLKKVKEETIYILYTYTPQLSIVAAKNDNSGQRVNSRRKKIQQKKVEIEL